MLLVIGTAAPPAGAEEVKGLYRAETIVTGTGEAESTRGLRICLTEVAIKLTGDPRLADGDRLASLLADPRTYVARIAYEDRMKGVPVHDEQGTRERPHFLRVTFDAARLDAALGDLGLVKWPADRPRLGVLMTVETPGARFLLTAGGQEGYGQRAVVAETAARLGLPVVLPTAEAAAPAVNRTDLLDRASAAEAVARGDPVLSGVLSLAADGGSWTMRWRLGWRGREKAWTLHGVTFDAAIRDGLNAAALVLSGHARL